jgi:RHS repeat-associated protein
VLGELWKSWKTSSSSPEQAYTYDALGNILQQTQGVSNTRVVAMNYQTVDRDRLCNIAYGGGLPSTSACRVKYDRAGNITELPTRSNGVRTLSYFPSGQVERVADGNGNDASFHYDAFGAVQQLDLTSNTSDDTRVDRHFGSMMSQRKEVVGGASTSVTIRKIAGPGVIATRHGSSATAPWTFAFGDSRGNRFFTDQNGVFVQDVDYLPYGEANSTGAQPGSPQYSTQQWNGGDSLAALRVSQLGARLYDPVIGRFLSRDPLIIRKTAATSNPYAFANNDPVSNSDPTGLCPMHLGSDCPELDPERGNGGGGGGYTPAPGDYDGGGHWGNSDSGGGGGGNSGRTPVSPNGNGGGGGVPHPSGAPSYSSSYAAVNNGVPPVPSPDGWDPIESFADMVAWFTTPSWYPAGKAESKRVARVAIEVGMAIDTGYGVYRAVTYLHHLRRIKAAFHAARDVVGDAGAVGAAAASREVTLGNAIGWTGSTNGVRVAEAMERMAAGGATEVSVGTGVHGARLGGGNFIIKDANGAAVFILEDLSAAVALQTRYPYLKIKIYDLGDPGEFAAFMIQVEKARQGIGCAIGAFCASAPILFK